MILHLQALESIDVPEPYTLSRSTHDRICQRESGECFVFSWAAPLGRGPDKVFFAGEASDEFDDGIFVNFGMYVCMYVYVSVHLYVSVNRPHRDSICLVQLRRSCKTFLYMIFLYLPLIFVLFLSASLFYCLCLLKCRYA
jgi:hypothetical protein